MNVSNNNSECTLLFQVSNKTSNIALTVVYTCIGIFIITTNTALLVVLPKVKKEMTRFDRLFMLQSVVDLTVGIVLMPLEVYLINKGYPVTCLDSAIKTMVSAFTSVLSGLITFFIANDRYLLIKKNQVYDTYMTKRLIVGILTVIVSVAIFWALFALQVVRLGLAREKIWFTLTFGIFASFMLIEVNIVNILLFRHVKNAPKTLPQPNKRTSNQYRIDVSKTILIISVCLVVAYVPSIFGFVGGSIMVLLKDPTNFSSSGTKYIIYFILPTKLNSGINSLVFISRNNAFRDYVKSGLGKIFSKNEVGANDIS